MGIVKFYVTPVYPYGNDHYYHEIIVLAEGFRDLGYQVCGNVDYWFEPDKKTYLIPKTDGSRPDIEIYDYRYVKSFEHLLFRPGYPNFNNDCIRILVDRNDWISPIWHNNKHYSVFDLILAGNLFSGEKYPENIRPSSIGLTNRQIQCIDRYANGNTCFSKIGYNFRVKHNLRKIVYDGIAKTKLKFPLAQTLTGEPSKRDGIDEIDRFYYKTTTKRHHPDYFKTINEYLLYFSVGGYYESLPLKYQPYSLLDRIERKPHHLSYQWKARRNFDFSKNIFVFQYDSFRLWETLYAKTCPIFLNFNRWKFRLPEIPVDGQHYIGIENFDFDEFAERINQLEENKIRKIGENGRKWVVAHYGPMPMAQRLLNWLE